MKDTLPCMMLVNARTTESFTLGRHFFEMPLSCTASQVKLANGKRSKSALDSARAARPHNKVAGLLCRHTHGPEGGGGDFFLMIDEQIASIYWSRSTFGQQDLQERPCGCSQRLSKGVNGCLELGPL